MTFLAFAAVLSSSMVVRSRLPVAQPVVSFAARSPVVCSAGVEDKIKAATSASNVMVFSKSRCPFCTKTKALFESLEVPYSVMELDELDDGAAIQDELLKMSGQRTVPSVWVGGKHLGGNDGAPSPHSDAHERPVADPSTPHVRRHPARRGFGRAAEDAGHLSGEALLRACSFFCSVFCVGGEDSTTQF